MPETPQDLKSSLLPQIHDAHCHPTTSTPSSILESTLRDLRLGSISAMSGDEGDQDLVRALSEVDEGREGLDVQGTRVLSWFGHHPWSTHHISIPTTSASSPSTQPSQPEPTAPAREEHYTSLLLSSTASPDHRSLVTSLLPHFPDPIPLPDLLLSLRQNLQCQLRYPSNLSPTSTSSLSALTSRPSRPSLSLRLGEVGIDKVARIPFPQSYLVARAAAAVIDSEQGDGREGQEEAVEKQKPQSKLSPFKTPIAHQKRVLNEQIRVLKEVFDEARSSLQSRVIDDPSSISSSSSSSSDGDDNDNPRRSRSSRPRVTTNISLHAVSATAVVEDLLTEWRGLFGVREWERDVRVCLHSCGLSSEAWKKIEKVHPNLYLSISPLALKPPHAAAPSASPSSVPAVFLTCSSSRLLVESDSADLRRSEDGCWEVVSALTRERDDWGERGGIKGVEGDEKVRKVVGVLEENWKRWIGEA